MTNQDVGRDEEPPIDPQVRELAERSDALRAKHDEFREKLEMIKDRRIAFARENAGVHFETMQHGPRVAEGFLDHPDPALRLAALAMFSANWGSDDRFGEACERMARTDSDERVRSSATACLGWRSWAEVVHDETREVSVRKDAYFSLYKVMGKPVMDRPRKRDFRFPEDVDWGLIRRLIARE